MQHQHVRPLIDAIRSAVGGRWDVQHHCQNLFDHWTRYPDCSLRGCGRCRGRSRLAQVSALPSDILGFTWCDLFRSGAGAILDHWYTRTQEEDSLMSRILCSKLSAVPRIDRWREKSCTIGLNDSLPQPGRYCQCSNGHTARPLLYGCCQMHRLELWSKPCDSDGLDCCCSAPLSVDL